MTNKEAIEIIRAIGLHTPVVHTGIKHTKDFYEAIDLAIKALEFTESQRICCDNCVNCNIKSKEACTSPFGECALFDTTAGM